jgi:hypothetical protein
VRKFERSFKQSIVFPQDVHLEEAPLIATAIAVALSFAGCAGSGSNVRAAPAATPQSHGVACSVADAGIERCSWSFATSTARQPSDVTGLGGLDQMTLVTSQGNSVS